MFIPTERIVEAYSAAKAQGDVWANMPLGELLHLEVKEGAYDQAGIWIWDLRRAWKMFVWGDFFMVVPSRAWRALCDQLPNVEFSITHLEAA